MNHLMGRLFSSMSKLCSVQRMRNSLQYKDCDHRDAREKAGVVSFILKGIHPHDIGTILDQEGIAIRTGHHCAQPVMQKFGIPATARASFAFYNTLNEIDELVNAIHKVKEVFGHV